MKLKINELEQSLLTDFLNLLVFTVIGFAFSYNHSTITGSRSENYGQISRWRFSDTENCSHLYEKLKLIDSVIIPVVTV